MEHPIIIDSKGKCRVRTPRWAFFRKLVDKAKRQIMEQEDAEIFKVLDSIADSNEK